MTQFMLLAFLSNPTSYIPGVKAFSARVCLGLGTNRKVGPCSTPILQRCIQSPEIPTSNLHSLAFLSFRGTISSTLSHNTSLRPGGFGEEHDRFT